MASASNEGLERREVHFSGRVQGVGFRYTARGLAERYGLLGYVQNLPDGRVLLVAEGPTANWDRLLATLAEEMDRFIHSTDVKVRPATGEFVQFEIRR
jgi:acylphosphatase